MGTTLTGTPTATLRQALYDLLAEGSFVYTAKTRDLIRRAEKALIATRPAAAHEKAVGLFLYSKEEHAYVPTSDELAIASDGTLKPGYEYLFKQPISLVQNVK